MFPPNSEYLAVAAFLALYVVLRLNLFQQVRRKLNARTLLFVFFCAIALVNVRAYRNKVIAGYGNDFVSPTEKALQELRKSLPKVGCVGFVSDIPKSRLSDRAAFLFILFTFSLSPATDGVNE